MTLSLRYCSSLPIPYAWYLCSLDLNHIRFQICDFGLAKWLPEQWTHHTVSKFEGTFGFVKRHSFVRLSIKHFTHMDSSLWFLECRYLAPEYLLHGIVDEKTDVFAFGVLLLELVTGRRALDYSKQSLVLWVCFFLICLFRWWT